MQEHWFKKLAELVQEYLLAVLRLGSIELEFISGAWRGINSFSVALPQSTLQGLRTPEQSF